MKKRMEILLVEDTPSDVRLTQEALKDTNLEHNLTILNDGEAATEYLKDPSKPVPDLMLLDLNMPKKNGHEVLADLKDDARLAKMPVILLTVSQDEGDILKALHLKLNYYINKPVDSDKLLVLLNAIQSLSDDDTAVTDAVGGEDAHVRYVMAGNPHTAPAILDRLATEKNHLIRCRVAENPQTSVITLITLSKDPDWHVRVCVADNPKTPLSVLEDLVRDPSDDVRLNMAGNPLLPDNILRLLTEDENMYVMTSAQKTVNNAATMQGQ